MYSIYVFCFSDDWVCDRQLMNWNRKIFCIVSIRLIYTHSLRVTSYIVHIYYSTAFMIYFFKVLKRMFCNFNTILKKCTVNRDRTVICSWQTSQYIDIMYVSGSILHNLVQTLSTWNLSLTGNYCNNFRIAIWPWPTKETCLQYFLEAFASEFLESNK